MSTRPPDDPDPTAADPAADPAHAGPRRDDTGASADPTSRGDGGSTDVDRCCVVLPFRDSARPARPARPALSPASSPGLPSTSSPVGWPGWSVVDAAAARVAAGLRGPRWWRQRAQRQRAATIAAYHAEIADRAARARAELARDGIHLGPVPYGYRLVHRRLVADPGTAAAVSLIFRWRAQGMRPAMIARTLSHSSAEFPPPHQRRTGHAGRGTRTGPAGRRAVGWTAPMVVAILANPRYTGRQVIRAARRHALRGTRFPARLWTPAVLTPQRTHPALVDDPTFRAAQWLAGRPAPAELLPPAPPTPPVPTGLDGPDGPAGGAW